MSETQTIAAIAFAGLALSGVVSGSVLGQSYPAKPIKLVIPFPPGGSTDVIGRLVGQKLSDALGQPVVVDNRGGAGGVIGADFTAKSPPDGYTILIGTPGAITISPSLQPKLPYQPIRD